MGSDYQETKLEYNQHVIEKSKMALWTEVVRRKFLLELKAKYAGVLSMCTIQLYK